MIDPVLWNDWHVVADRTALRAGEVHRTRLLDEPLMIAATAGGAVISGKDGPLAHQACRYGLVWACLGTPARSIPPVPEFAEAGRCITTAGSVAVHVSGPRVVENFLDLGHLGYVHAGYLGAEPHTEIVPYRIEALPEGGLVASGCKVFQPMSSPAAQGGYVVEYSYRVLRPLTVCLFKANPLVRDRCDAIYLFVQPVSEEHAVAHALMLFVADGTDAEAMRAFQQMIFMQDKPILENQVPKRLPLAPGAELAIAADRSSVAYRRWLASLGLRYGVIAEASGAPRSNLAA